MIYYIIAAIVVILGIPLIGGIAQKEFSAYSAGWSYASTAVVILIFAVPIYWAGSGSTEDSAEVAFGISVVLIMLSGCCFSYAAAKSPTLSELNARKK